jgi:transcriptional regulator with XRE-family HTH domain
MLGLSQTKLADALGITFQQVQKYEKGANRISASRLQQMAGVLQVPVPFFFDGLPAPNNATKQTQGPGMSPEISIFLATSDGLSLIKAYSQIKKRNLKRAIVRTSLRNSRVNRRGKRLPLRRASPAINEFPKNPSGLTRLERHHVRPSASAIRRHVAHVNGHALIQRAHDRAVRTRPNIERRTGRVINSALLRLRVHRREHQNKIQISPFMLPPLSGTPEPHS